MPQGKEKKNTEMKAGELQAAETGHKGPSCCTCMSRFCCSSIQSLASSSRQGELSAHRSASQAQASATYVYQRSPNYASKSRNVTPPQQNVRRSQSERSRGRVCTSSSRCQDRASGVQVTSPPKTRRRQQHKRRGDSYPERSLRGLPASSFSYWAKIYKTFYSQTTQKL